MSRIWAVIALLAFAPPASADPLPQLPGRVVVMCGGGASSYDVYELSTGALTRRTDFGVGAMSVAGGRIAITRLTPGDLGEHVEVAPLAGDGFHGRRIGDGGTPALAADGTLAWSTVTKRANGYLGNAVYVRRPGAHKRRLSTYAYVWQQQFVGRRLFALITSRKRQYEVRGVGTPKPQMILLHGMKQPAGIAWSPSGRTAYGSGRRSGNRIRLLSAAGRPQASFATDAFPLAWSPDERSLLVGSPRGLGLLDPATGAITELGPLPCGATVGAVWLAG